MRSNRSPSLFGCPSASIDPRRSLKFGETGAVTQLIVDLAIFRDDRVPLIMVAHALTRGFAHRSGSQDRGGGIVWTYQLGYDSKGVTMV